MKLRGFVLLGHSCVRYGRLSGSRNGADSQDWNYSSDFVEFNIADGEEVRWKILDSSRDVGLYFDYTLDKLCL